MAITATATIGASASPWIPDTYVAPTLPTITPVTGDKYTVQVAITAADASDPSTGISNILAALETDFVSNQAVTLNLDATATIQSNITLVTVTRTNTVENVFVLGVEQYTCAVSYERT